MPKLVLKLADSVLTEKIFYDVEISIGRSSDNGLVIDSPLVSRHHARVFKEDNRMMLEDLGSPEGTLVEDQRVRMVTLKAGDSFRIGNHTVVVVESWETSVASAEPDAPVAVVPNFPEPALLNTQQRRELLHRVSGSREPPPPAPGLFRVAALIVRKGRTDQREYVLRDKLTVIGKAATATIRLKSWFAPRAAAQVNRRDDNSYYVGAADLIPTVNGYRIVRPAQLSPGDIIEVAGVRLEFQYRD